MKKTPNIIHLEKSDFKLVKQLNKTRKRGCSSLHIKKSFDKHINSELRYNKKTGVMRDNSGVLSEYVYKTDIPKNYTREDVIEWLFMNEIANSCSRIRRGYKP